MGGDKQLKLTRRIVSRVLHPSSALVIILAIFSAAALVLLFIFKREEKIEAYIIYALATYSFTMLAIGVPKIASAIKELIHRNKLGNRYLTDIPFRVKISLYSALFLNLVYAVFKLLAGIHYASFWYGADAFYYIVLSTIRFLLLRNVRSEKNDPDKEFRKYRLCGILLFLLNAALMGVVYQMVNHGVGYEYPGLLIYVVATYAFYCITLATVNVIKYRKLNSPVFSAAKNISLARALVAMYALQNAMFASFGGDDTVRFEQIMNSVFGGCVCLAVFCMAVLMVIRANKNLKMLTINNSETFLKHNENI
jgi:MFS family permease